MCSFENPNGTEFNITYVDNKKICKDTLTNGDDSEKVYICLDKGDPTDCDDTKCKVEECLFRLEHFSGL